MEGCIRVTTKNPSSKTYEEWVNQADLTDCKYPVPFLTVHQKIALAWIEPYDETDRPYKAIIFDFGLRKNHSIFSWYNPITYLQGAKMISIHISMEDE